MFSRYITYFFILFVVFFDLSFRVHSHEYTPAFLSLSEKSVGQFSMQWKVDKMAGLNKRLIPQFSPECVSTLISISPLPEAEIHHSTLSCLFGSSGLSVNIKGLAGSKTDVLFRVNYLNGNAFNYRLTIRCD